MAGTKVLTEAAEEAILLLYNERDSRGRRKHSMAQVAKLMGVSETTVGRVVNRLGAYVAGPTADELAGAVPGSPAAAAKAEDSLKRLQGLLQTPDKQDK